MEGLPTRRRSQQLYLPNGSNQLQLKWSRLKPVWPRLLVNRRERMRILTLRAGLIKNLRLEAKMLTRKLSKKL